MTPRSNLTMRDFLWGALVALLCGCSPQDTPTWAKNADTAEHKPSAVFANMPVNSDRRCLGIAIVMEALLETKSPNPGASEQAETLAEKLYAMLGSSDKLRIPQFVEIEGQRKPVLSRDALEKLSTLIADRYKQDYTRSVATTAGSDRLLAAEREFVRSSGELAQILDADSDRTVAFCGVGVREFPDGELRNTNHVLLLHKQQDGKVFVHDPNDPGAPVPCRLEETEDGVLVEWTCRYRDTGMVTTQTYHVVSLNRYFTLAFGSTEN